MRKTVRQVKDDYARSFVKGDFPTLEELVNDYPEHAEELAGFVMDFWPFADFMKLQLTETLLWWVDDNH